MIVFGNVLEENVKIKEGTIVALGKFDGIHKGHRMLIDCLKEGKKDGLKAVVFTFTRAPGEWVNNSRLKYILTGDEKRKIVENCDVDILVECPLVTEIMSMEPQEFISEVLVKRLNVKKIICGEDFKFGYRRKGSGALLRELSSKYGYETIIIPKLRYCGKDVSSTYIREAIAEGDIGLANKLLGYGYMVTGVVAHGKKLGRTIGFPTVNLEPDTDKLLPPNGVYKTVVTIGKKEYHGITNIGIRPTVDVDNKARVNVETHILDFDEDVYGKEITVTFYEFLRREKRFNSVEELKRAVDKDIKSAW